jgi:hypothetical protein
MLGLVPLVGGLLCGFFAVLPVLRWLVPSAGSTAAEQLDVTSFVIIGLFGPMAVILLGAAWAMFRYVLTGQQGPVLHRGAVMVFGGVLLVLVVTMVVMGIADGQIDMVLGAVGDGGFLLLLIWAFLRRKPRPTA